MGRRSTGRGAIKRLAAMAGLAALLACSPQTQAESSAEPAGAGAETATTHPISGLKVIPLTVTTDDGQIAIAAELADTPETQARGLMFRTELGPDEGMIFPTEEPRARSFWMKNTPLPLDLIFIGPDRRIANIAAMAEPYSLDPIPSEGAVIAVFEIAGGRAAELGIEPGDAVAW